jgi:hydrogenase maturation protein HypF
VLDDLGGGVDRGQIAAKFHSSLKEAILALGRRMGEERIVRTGGCFQNRYLTERAVTRFRSKNCSPFWHHQVPPNDGGIALGQVVAAARAERERVRT